MVFVKIFLIFISHLFGVESAFSYNKIERGGKMNDLEIKEGLQQFYIGKSEGDAIARITYAYDGNGEIIANHTFVSPELRGQQIAKKLLDRLVVFARDNNLKIRPTCSYVVKAFERYEEYQDVAAD